VVYRLVVYFQLVAAGYFCVLEVGDEELNAELAQIGLFHEEEALQPVLEYIEAVELEGDLPGKHGTLLHAYSQQADARLL